MPDRRDVLPVVLAVLAGRCDRLLNHRQVVVGQDHRVARAMSLDSGRRAGQDPGRQAARPGFW
jgi:hypothetical protein